MKYFKNRDLIKLYNVSDKAIRNWIIAAQQDKNGLELYERDEKTYIADTLENSPILDALVERGRKYRNSRTYKIIRPSATFYDLYSAKQVVDIANSIEIHGEYPLHYRYFGKCAYYWNAYLHKLHTSGSANLLTSSVELLDQHTEQLIKLTEKFTHINLVDLGVGNGLAVKKLISRLQDVGKLEKYIGVDTSQDLLNITERNIKDWFNDSIRVETHIKDLSHERFTDILSTDSYGDDSSETINVILFLGGTIMNFREPDQAIMTIRESMSKNDILVTTLKLDSEPARRFFDFNLKTDQATLPRHHSYMLDILSIDESMYSVEQFFDSKKLARFIQIKFKNAASIEFDLKSFNKRVDILKGSTLLLARIAHFSDIDVINIFVRNKLCLMQVTKSVNNEYLLLIARASSQYDIHS